MRAYLFWILLFLSVPRIWRAPFLGVVLYSALNLVRPEMFFWGGNTGARSLIFLFGVTLASVFFNYHKLPVKSFLSRETILLLWLYVAVLVSILLSQYNVNRAYYYANELGKLFLFCSIMVLTIDSKKKIIRYEMVMLSCFAFLGVWGIDQHFRGNARLEGLGGHAYPDTNGVAAAYVLFFPVALNYALNGKSKLEKGGGAAAALIMLILIIFTQSRGGFLGLTIATCMIVVKSNKKFKILVYSISLFLLALPFISSQYIARLKTITPQEGQPLESSANSRLYLWQAGMMVFADNPIFGAGFMAYPEAKMKYKSRFSRMDPEFRDYVFRETNKKVTHNTYIQLLSECGILGFVPFYLLVFGSLWQNFKIRNQVRGHPVDMELLHLLSAIEAGIWGYCVSIFFINNLTMVFMPWQLIICAVIRRLLHEQLAGRTEPVKYGLTVGH